MSDPKTLMPDPGPSPEVVEAAHLRRLEAMATMATVDPGFQTITVEAGVLLAAFRAAERAGRAQVETAKNAAYSERNRLVAAMAHIANGFQQLGFRAGVGQHPESDTTWENDWRTLLFIDTPMGQLSWHFHDSERHMLEGLPPYAGKWDGHTTDEKYERLRRAAAPTVKPKIFVFCNGCSPGWHTMVALAEDGHCLAGHICSDHGYAAHDMGISCTGWKRDLYAKHYPQGFEVVWVEDLKNDPAFEAAHQKHLALPPENSTPKEKQP